MQGRFWYSERQEAIWRELKQELNVCRVTLCGGRVKMQYTEMRPMEDRSYEPARENDSLYLGEGTVAQFNIHMGEVEDAHAAMVRLKGD